ncbi:MAG: sulfurtransferase TusA family protein [Spirochaetes bacterium]|nr:sulfurtransferase TusA family protein [Spirochaetota bacterium]
MKTTYDIPAAVTDDITLYGVKADEFRQGKLDAATFKAIRVPMGVYEQREKGVYMLRCRIPGGAITPEQLILLVGAARAYTGAALHLTTRQDVQIHGLTLEHTAALMQDLRKIGLVSRGGGGNTVRNITGDYLAGVADDEAFDVTPYVRALTGRLIAEADSWKLPRKFKIAFSGSAKDRAYATVNDLGFIAKKNAKGEHGFAVFIAGGMGMKPRAGIRLAEFVPASEVYNIAKAAKNLFNNHGNRKNRYRARLRFVLEKFGAESFITLFEKELAAVKDAAYPPLSLAAVPLSSRGYFEIPLFLGDISLDNAELLGTIMRAYHEESIRFTPEQNILVRGLSSDETGTLRERLTGERLLKPMHPVIHHAIACTGAATCRLGICLSRNLLDAIRERIEREQLPEDNIADITLKISGCPNTCGQHMVADIGFFGSVRRIDDHVAPCYTLVTGGGAGEGRTALALKRGVIPARAIPSFLLEFLKDAAVTRNTGEPFGAYLMREGNARIETLLQKYADIPRFDDNKEIYFDWGSEHAFSALEKMEGECSASLFDLIDLDFRSARDAALHAKDTHDEVDMQELLRQAVAAVSRALLITKGVEVSDAASAVDAFRIHFAKPHLGDAYDAVLNAYTGHTPIDIQSVEALITAVYSLYETMDDTLKMPLAVRQEPAVRQVKQVKDFRGVACPLNFVKTKLVLETMERGELLEVLLDDGAPIENVPASLKAENHRIVEQKKAGDHWSIIVEKGD